MTECIIPFIYKYQDTIVIISLLILYFIIRSISIKLYNCFEDEKTEIK